MVSGPSKLVLCVIDAMSPTMLKRAIDDGAAPVLQALMEAGDYTPSCVAAFPSVTPVCAASIVTGAWQDQHRIPGMNWYDRQEDRYVEYGSSLKASQRFGIAQQLIDTVYNLNRSHLAPEPLTIFERLDDAGLRTAGTTYLMYRGRYEHEPDRERTLSRIAAMTLMRHPVMGPRELFYADIFASRRTPCRSVFGMPGIRDRHSGCVGAHLVEHDLFDFLLLSLPDNDWYSHKYGPEAQVRSIAAADAQLSRVAEAAGGLDAFLGDHAVIVLADHSQAPVSASRSLQDDLEELSVLRPDGRCSRGGRPKIAVCPSQRAAMVYVLDPEQRDALRPRIVRQASALSGVELTMWLERDAHGAPREGVVRGPDGELRFAPGGELLDARGAAWSVEGQLRVLAAEVRDGLLLTPSHPDALSRVYAALTCETSGDVLLSAAPGFEFGDWGGEAHIGGGSHGSLRAEDSLGPLLSCGLGSGAARPSSATSSHPPSATGSHPSSVPGSGPSSAPGSGPSSARRGGELAAIPSSRISDVVPMILDFFHLRR